MIKQENLNADLLDSLFEEVSTANNVVEQIIHGELDEHTLTRIKKLSSFILGQDTKQHRYTINLAEPHPIHNQVTMVYQAGWVTVSPALAEGEGPELDLREMSGAVYHPKTQPELPGKYEIFSWFDSKTDKISLADSPVMIPNIFHPEGVEELIRTTNFEEEVNG